ncbi:MAG: TolC family protein [Nitrospirae bacterium]|nr:TolC family protein [Magnetococcales bacterium]HAT50632.1 hypothetical protein [Alphaproteobacteria bacterium]
MTTWGICLASTNPCNQCTQKGLIGLIKRIGRRLLTRHSVTVNRRAVAHGRLLALEPRMMFDAAGFSDVVDGLAYQDATPKVTSSTDTVIFSTDGRSISLPEITIDAADHRSLVEARLELGANFDAVADKLDFSDNNTIVGAWDEGVLTLTPKNGRPLSADQFQAALNKVTYLYRHTGTETALNLADRTVTVTVADGYNESTPLVFTLQQDTQIAAETGLNFAPTLQQWGGATLVPSPGHVADPDLKTENPATLFTTVGYLVANLLGNRVDDPNIVDDLDPHSKVENQGMAVVAVDDAHGHWDYSTDGGTQWSELVAVRPESAVLLTGTEKDRIRFVPDAGFTGETTLSFRAWDGKDDTSGLEGHNTLHNGGTTPYSTEIASWTFAVVPGAAVSFKNQSVTPLGNDHSQGSSLSDDGNLLVFASDATNLVSGDTNGYRDIFLRDNATGKIQLLSQGKSGQANGDSDDPVISGDGSTVVFVSSASNLVAGDNNFCSDIFRYDIADGTMERVSVHSDGIEANGASDSPDISTRGDRIVYVSRGTNLVTGDGNGVADVFLRDTVRGETVHLSVATAQGWADGASFDPAISGDGQWVVFASDASNLVMADTNGMTDVFRVAATGVGGVTRLQGVAAPDGPSGHPDINADGSRVVFASFAENLAAADGNGVSDIVLVATGQDVTILSRDADGGAANGGSVRPALSSDGRFVTFISQATDINNPGISSSDINGMADLFLHAIDTGQTVRISQHNTGIESNGPVVSTPAINGDGHRVSYVSSAGNLVDGTSAMTTVRQLFLAEVNGAPVLDKNHSDLKRAIAEPDVKKGVTIAELLGSGYRDVNTDDLQGVAVTGLSGKGAWQFSTNNGSNWSDLTESSESAATLLAEDGQTRIRFIPEKVPYDDGASITFYAWDGTMGDHAQAGVAMTFKGGATAFSAKSLTLEWRVKTTKTEPVLAGVNLTSVRYAPDNNLGITIAHLVEGHFSGTGPIQGVALTGIDTTHGDWQISYQGDFSDAVTLSGLSPASMTLLQGLDTTRIRFVPRDAGFTGAAPLSFRAWDGLGGEVGQQGVNADSMIIFNTLGRDTERVFFSPNQSPVGVADTFRVISGQSITLPVLANDRDGDGDPLVIRGITQPSLGSLFWDKDNNRVIYQAPGHPGTTQWHYFVGDGLTNPSVPVTVSMDIGLAPSSGPWSVAPWVPAKVRPLDRPFDDRPFAHSQRADPPFATLVRVASPTVRRMDSLFFGMGRTDHERSFWGSGGLPWKIVQDFAETERLPLPEPLPQEHREGGGDRDHPSGGGQPQSGPAGSVPESSGRQGFSRQIAALVARQNYGWLGLLLLLVGGCSVQPAPLQPVEVGNRVLHDFEQMVAEEPLALQPITLDMAMDMALQHNLERRVKMVEEALAHGQYQLALQQLLPSMRGSVRRHERSREGASISESVGSGMQTSDYTTSLERAYTAGDATLVWNVLDFGVSYIRSQQQADDGLIAQERHRKVMQDLLRDVRFTYWQAVGAEMMLPEVDQHLQAARKALEKSRKLEEERLQSSDEAMNFQEELLRQIQLLMELQKELLQSKTRLAALINLRPGTPYTLDVTGWDRLVIPEVLFSPGQLEALAMVSRPELREEDYQERISAMETRVALLKILPGFETTISGRYDDNRYLQHSNWGEVAYGLSASLNDLFAAPARIETAQIRQQLAVARRLAMAMTVLTQVNLALQDFQQARNDYTLANELWSLKKRQTLREVAVQSARGGSSMVLERRQVEYLVAAIQRDRAYAAVQNAYGMILNSVGLEQFPPPDAIQGDDVLALAEYVHGQRYPEESHHGPQEATSLAHRYDQALQWFGIQDKEVAVHHVESKVWKLGDASKQGSGEQGRDDEPVTHEGTKKWVLVNQ